jgi:hypothetical protein
MANTADFIRGHKNHLLPKACQHNRDLVFDATGGDTPATTTYLHYRDITEISVEYQSSVIRHRVHVSFCCFQRSSENVNGRTRAFYGRLRFWGFLEEEDLA